MKLSLFLIVASTTLYSGFSFAQGGAAGMGGGGDDTPADFIRIMNSNHGMGKCAAIQELIEIDSSDLRLPSVKGMAAECNIELPQIDPNPRYYHRYYPL